MHARRSRESRNHKEHPGENNVLNERRLLLRSYISKTNLIRRAPAEHKRNNKETAVRVTDPRQLEALLREIRDEKTEKVNISEDSRYKSRALSF